MFIRVKPRPLSMRRSLNNNDMRLAVDFVLLKSVWTSKGSKHTKPMHLATLRISEKQSRDYYVNLYFSITRKLAAAGVPITAQILRPVKKIIPLPLNREAETGSTLATTRRFVFRLLAERRSLLGRPLSKTSVRAFRAMLRQR